MDRLKPADFPLLPRGQYVYARSQSSPIIGPVAPTLADDLAFRLNRDQAAAGSWGGSADVIDFPNVTGPEQAARLGRVDFGVRKDEGE